MYVHHKHHLLLTKNKMLDQRSPSNHNIFVKKLSQIT